VPATDDTAERGRAALVELLRSEGPRVLAVLTRTTGSLPVAEDAVQDAVLRALENWPRAGIPAEPRAWLLLTARRRAVDLLRRESARPGKEAEAVALLISEDDGPPPDDGAVRDDLLRLLFTCCHPALELHTRVALALRLLCGLTTAEVARALLVPEATMAKRLTRAKQKIVAARIPYRVPAAHELPDRLAAVLATVYLLFNEGYDASGGDQLVRGELCDEAIRLARLLRELFADDASVMGLLALLLLTDSRRAARVDAHGDPVLLAEQDRSRWDHARITEGVELVGEALRRTPARPDPYVVQAAIASCHALARAPAETDWAAVVSWYDVLLTVQDSPVVRLNRAAALAERDGPQAGLAALDRLRGLAGYALLPAARGELLARLGRAQEAAAEFEAALALPLNAVERRSLQRRLAEVRAGSAAAPEH
jgi:RNA polymerase sigma-70 factor (ECF subfamily)